MAPGEQYLPPVETTFALALRGYDRSQVAEHLRLVNAELRMIAADRDAAVEQASQLTYQLDASRTESEGLKAQLTRMSAPPDTVDGMSERLQWMLRLAQDEVREMRSRAEADCESIRSTARDEADTIEERNREQTARLDAEYTRVQSEIEQHRAEATAELDRLREEAVERRATLDAEAETKRTEIEAEFTRTMTSRREEIEAELAELEQQRRAEADRIRSEATAEAERVTAEATEQARRMLAEARDRVTELRVARERIRAQLDSTRRSLDRALPVLDDQSEDDLPEASDDGDNGSASEAGDQTTTNHGAPHRKARTATSEPPEAKAPLHA